jgi:hypothetical protein
MSGTPMQQSPADLCKFGNFLSKSHDYDARIFAKKMADLVWVSAMIKNISWLSAVRGAILRIVPLSVIALRYGRDASYTRYDTRYLGRGA